MGQPLTIYVIITRDMRIPSPPCKGTLMCTFGNRVFTTLVFVHKILMTSTQKMPRYRREDVRHKDHPGHQQWLHDVQAHADQMYGEEEHSNTQHESSDDGELWREY